MKFKIDENLPVELRGLLRAHGHDAATVLDQSHGGRPDQFIFEVCKREDRAIMTLDTDFGDIRSYPPGSHAGIVLVRVACQDKAGVLRAVEGALPLLRTEPLAGRLWVVEETTVRIRDSK